MIFAAAHCSPPGVSVDADARVPTILHLAPVASAIQAFVLCAGATDCGELPCHCFSRPVQSNICIIGRNLLGPREVFNGCSPQINPLRRAPPGSRLPRGKTHLGGGGPPPLCTGAPPPPKYPGETLYWLPFTPPQWSPFTPPLTALVCARNVGLLKIVIISDIRGNLAELIAVHPWLRR